MAFLKLMDLKTSKSFYESATPNQERARYVLPKSAQVPYLVTPSISKASALHKIYLLCSVILMKLYSMCIN